MIHQVSYSASFSGCLEFSPMFFQSFFDPSDAISLAVFEVRRPRELTSFFY